MGLRLHSQQHFQLRFLAHIDEFAADLDMEESNAVAIHDALRHNMREWLTADAAS